ncbi:MAG: T9SS type A sorting domain-containing protein [Bacteroidia bacterium]|nr:T9SS type A sorting domain-containing protein [Bacteroidia bacterium]
MLVRIFLFLVVISGFIFSQTTVNFNYTGAFQTWTVPSCVSGNVTVTVRGGKGGGALGGAGAVVTGVISVTPGQVLRIYVGGQGGCPTGGWNGGGNGGFQNTFSGQTLACGGGGATDVRVAPYGLANRVIVAGGGGGQSGGSTPMYIDYTFYYSDGYAPGGNGGCPNGLQGFDSFGIGGQGGTLINGGTGGAPWCSPCGQPGFSGSLAIGGNGGDDIQNIYAAGGGGGGGVYGGGGGGADGCCIGANGGGGGGGGSSLVPAGGVCSSTNNANGSASISYLCPLPIELVSFYTECNENEIIFKWTTQMEINNEYYEIQGSNSGNDWFKIDRINGKGTSFMINNYEYRYKFNRFKYYRLLTIDKNKNEEVISTITNNCNNYQFEKWSIYPLPCMEQCQITVVSDEWFEIFDISGKKVEEFFVKFSNEPYVLQTEKYQKGIYYIKSRSGNNFKKLVIY